MYVIERFIDCFLNIQINKDINKEREPYLVQYTILNLKTKPNDHTLHETKPLDYERHLAHMRIKKSPYKPGPFTTKLPKRLSNFDVTYYLKYKQHRQTQHLQTLNLQTSVPNRNLKQSCIVDLSNCVSTT